MNTLAVLLVAAVAAVAVLPSCVQAQANKADPIMGNTGLFAKFTPVAATVPKVTDGKCSKMRSKNVWTPFTLKFQDPPLAPVKASTCDANNRCMDYFEITATQVAVQVAQTGPKTIWYGYGSIPGPMFHVCKGRQSIVKITNNITADVSISTHLHGAATLSPWDGWADDVTDYGNAKFYRYPNNRAATLWYHDHDIHHTARNAYYGLAGIYWVRDCCEDEQRESLLPSGKYEHALMIGDRTIDPANNNQLYFQLPGTANDFWGDIIIVNGIPWPVMDVEPRTYRFRALNIGVTRTYTISLDSKSTDIPMYLVGTDGGLLQSPVRIQQYTHEVGARYEFVLDFTGASGREIVLVNNNMPDFGQDDYCWTHLIMKFRVSAKVPNQSNTPISAGLKLHVGGGTPLAPTVTPKKLIDDAVIRANQDKFDKHFLFHHSNGEWQVNGRTWDDPVMGHIETFVKENDFELWKIENGGGGWIHPIHLHLVDFFVVRRTKIGQLAYDPYGPKDVVLIRPSETVYALARFGAHQGQWMFHCHNLMHEDNDMMRAFEIQGPNLMSSFVPDSPLPSNAISADPMGDRAVTVAKLGKVNLVNELAKSWYDVYYPPKQPKAGVVSSTNMWEVTYNRACVRNTILNPIAPGAPIVKLGVDEESIAQIGGSGAAGVAVGTILIVCGVAATLLVAVVAVVVYRRRINSMPNMTWDDEGAVAAAAAPTEVVADAPDEKQL